MRGLELRLDSLYAVRRLSYCHQTAYLRQSAKTILIAGNSFLFSLLTFSADPLYINWINY